MTQENKKSEIATPPTELDDLASAVGTLLFVAKERDKLSTRTKELDELELAALEQVQEKMGKSEAATYKGKPVFTWRTTERRILDQKRLAAEKPELVEEYKRVSESRSFKVEPSAIGKS